MVPVKVLLNDEAFTPFDPETARLRWGVQWEERGEIFDVPIYLGYIFMQLNVDEPCEMWAVRYRQQRNRSLSVGDVIVVGEVAYGVDRVGFERISLDQTVMP